MQTSETAAPGACPVRHNVVAMFAGSLAVNAAHFLIGWLIVVSLGEAAHGAFSIILGLITITTLMSLSGLMEAKGVRDIASALAGSRSEAQGHVDTAIRAGLMTSLLLGIFLFLGAEMLAGWLGSDIASLIRWAAVWPVAMALLQVGTMIGDGFERMWISACCLAVFHWMRLIWLLIAIGLSFSLEGIFVGWAIGMPMAGLLCMLFARQLLNRHGLRLRISLYGTIGAVVLVMKAIPFSVARSTAVMLPSVVAIFVAFAGGSKETVSYLMILYGLAAVPLIFSCAVTSAAFPAMVRLIKQSEDGPAETISLVNRLVWRSMGVILAGHFCALVGYTVLGRRVLEMVYGSNYADRSIVLVILTIAVMVEAVRHLIDHLLMARGQMQALFGMELLRYLLLLVLTMIWVPSHGAMGAGFGVVVAGIAGLLGRLSILKVGVYPRAIAST